MTEANLSTGERTLYHTPSVCAHSVSEYPCIFESIFIFLTGVSALYEYATFTTYEDLLICSAMSYSGSFRFVQIMIYHIFCMLKIVPCEDQAILKPQLEMDEFKDVNVLKLQIVDQHLKSTGLLVTGTHSCATPLTRLVAQSSFPCVNGEDEHIP